MKILHKSKRALPPLPQVAELINTLLETPNEDLHEVLAQIDTWKWPRSDLNAWIKVLNKFDEILEEVIRDYDIDKLQVNVLTPLTKKTVCEILRFERLLLENSTNRKTFNSYDRLNSLMFTSDLDVLILTLNLLLRPAQQYSAQPAVSHALNISTPRLTSLARRWPNVREFDVNLADLVDKGSALVDALPNEAREVTFTFYRKDATPPGKGKEKAPDTDVFESPSVATPARKGTAPSTGQAAAAYGSGSVTIHIDSLTLESRTAMDVLADVTETYSVPEDEKFELLCRIRTTQALQKGHFEDREKLATIRLLATAIFGHTHQETQAQSALFLYEADLTNRIADLLQLDRDISYQVQTAAIAALDALGRYRNKIQEVLSAVNAGVNHGILMALLRRTVMEVANPESNIPQSFVEALLSFVTFIATHAAGGNMVVGAGLVPLMVQIIENRLPQRLYVVSKTMQLVDNVLYGYNNAFQMFCNAHGVDVLVNRIQYEVDLDLEEFGDSQSPADIPVSHGKLSVARAAVLKHTMRSMHRMMQSSGTSEGLRGLLDSSLAKSAKKIMENRSVFGPSVLPIAINIMATFIHNEPTCLNVIQEAGLPEAFYHVVESGLEPVIEVIQAVPNAIGALCLNQAGQDQLAARPEIIPGLFSIFTSERHQRVLQEKENAVIIGTSIEELIRHHPSLKDAVFNAIKETMARIEELGKAYVVPDDLKQWYRLQPVKQSPGVETSADADVAMDVADNSTNANETSSAPEATPGPVEDTAQDEDSTKPHDNIIVSYIDVFSKFLEGFFQHIPHCREFISNTEGLERLGRLTALPCLPYDFANSVASDSLVQVIRTMIEAATSETLNFLVKMVNESLAETAEFREVDGGPSRLLSIVDVTEEEEAQANESFRKMITLHIRIMLLSDIYTTAGYSQGRATGTLLQSLTGRDAANILPDLGTLHRTCLWENILLKASTGNKGALDHSFDSQQHISGSGSNATPSAPSAAADPSTLATPNGVPSETPTTEGSPAPPEPTKSDSPRESNVKAIGHLASQIPSSLAPFFQSVVRMFQIRRNPDETQKRRILETAGVIADVLLKHLEPRTCEDKLSLFAYYTVMLGVTSILLIDERSSTKTLHAVLLHAFYRKGGIDAIMGICRSFIKAIEEVGEIKVEERSSIDNQILIHAHGGLKVALHLLLPIVSSKPLFESAQTTLLMTPEKKNTDPDYFEPHNFVVQLRLAVLPLLREIWEAPWLVSAPLSVGRSVVQALLEVLNVECEEARDTTADIGVAPSLLATAGAPISRAVGPDENRIRQLTEMGFPRSAAERALVRTRNNVSAATELLLAQPFPLPPDPEPAEPTEPTADPEAHEAADAADAAVAPVAPAEDAAMSSEGEENDPSEETEAPPVEEQGPQDPPGDPPAGTAESEASATASKSPEELLKELNAAREPLKEGIGRRALQVVDEHPALVFDVQRIFVGPSSGYRDQAVHCLIEDIKAFSAAAYDKQEHAMSVRFRLLALVLSEPSSPLSAMSEAQSQDLMNVLLGLVSANPANPETGHPAIPKWLALHLLVAEALLMMGEEPRAVSLPKEDEPIVQSKIEKGPMHPEARSTLFDFCLRLLAVPNLPRDELLSSLRLFVLLTRDHRLAVEFVQRDGLGLIFGYLKISSATPSVAGTHPYIAMILRHIVEDPVCLQSIMQSEVKRFFAHPRNRSIDVGLYVRNCGAMALRDPNVFKQATASLCQLSHPYGTTKTISLKESDKSPHETSAAAAGGGSEMQIDEPAPHDTGSTSEVLENVVHFLVAELIKATKADQSPEAATTEPSNARDAVTVFPDTTVPVASSVEETRDGGIGQAEYAYSCFLMQCLTELLFSYDSCKIAFLSYSPKRRLHTPSKETALKHRTAALQFLISDLMSFGTINPQPPPGAKRQIMLCNWAMSVVVALCVDTSPTQDIKDVPAERVSVRKFVLEAINRAIKDLPASENADERYSRLLALADLCYRLLTVRFNTGSRRANDETPTHIAKIMLEKNFVATLTNALAEVDLNYPHVRGVITGILRPLEYLTKIAIKMSRVSDKNKDHTVAKTESIGADSELSDIDEVEGSDHEETPDLYRHSALGMYGGEMEDVHYGHDDEMDEDVEEEDDDVDMEYGDETGSEDTSNTDEDEVGNIEDELEHGSGESEEGWNEDDEEEEADLVENDEDHDDEGEDEGQDEGDEEVMWQDVAVGEDVTGDPVDDIDEEEAEDTIPIVPADVEEEGDILSEADEFGDDIGIHEIEHDGAGPVFEIAGGFADGIMNANPREGQPLFWQGGVRGGRRRLGATDDDLDGFARSRNPSVISPPEGAIHPLLLDPTPTQARSSTSYSRTSRRLQRSLVSGIPQDLMQTIENVIGEGAIQLFHHIVAHGRGGGGETIRIDVPSGGLIPPYLQRHGRGGISAAIRLERAPRPGDARVEGRSFEPLLTLQRWAEEVKTLHGKFELSRIAKLTNHIVLALLPAAAEAAKRAKIEEEKEAETRREAEKKAEEEEEAAKKKQEEEDKARSEQAKAEQEAAEAAHAAAQPPAHLESTASEPRASTAAALDVDIEMEDASSVITTAVPDSSAVASPGDQGESRVQEGGEPSQPDAGTSVATERVTVMIHGSPVDITETGIDPTFLEALPDDMREEVLNQHVRDQRAARVERPADSQISPEFLDALPPEIRAEILQQESVERARRRAEQVVPQQATGTPADIDPASFIASLDPQLRQAVLMDSDDVFIQGLPSHMLAEAGLYRETQRPPRTQALSQATGHPAPPQVPHPHKAPASRDAIQLLDKSAIAVLVRLLFFPQVLKKNLLSKVLVNLCENSKTRTDIFNLLLSILQDGTGDLASIDKSFAQMSFRSSKQPSPQTPKAAGKQRSQADYLSQLSLPQMQNEIVPELVAQRCVDTLTYIVSSNELSSLFFLTEHEMPAGLRRNSSKKGKGKEKQAPQTHYPIVLLLSLLDRQSLLKTPSLMESVVALLALLTRPLTSLKDSKKASEGETALASTAGPAPSASVSAPVQQPDSAFTDPTGPNAGAGPATDAPPAPEDPPPAAPSDPQPAEVKPREQAATMEEKILLANPPTIPHPVLRSIVNVLTAGECSGRAFSHSLALIQHLSYIPDARDVIAQELRTRAQEFGQNLLGALDELAVALQKHQEDVIANLVATKFSQASSDQAKLLRVLKTIDYMYSPKPTVTTAETIKDADVEKVQNIYESFRFAALWRRLGDCLATVEEDDKLEHIAIVLMPLIESLMVVCKYAGPKAASSAATRALRASASPRSPASSRESMEDLFVSFTDAHRKILNLLVRGNPSLMSGSFSLLVNNPRVLDFDNKRNYFNQQLHRRPHAREHHGTLQLNVRRQRVFEDSFQYLQRKTGEQIKYGKLSVRFYDEEGVDAGGVTREWFQILARQMFNPNYALFQPCAADRLTYQPNKASYVNPEHLSFFKFVGRVIGKAIYDGRLLDAYFARSLYRQLLGKPVDYRDVEWVDPEYYNSLCWILENDPSALELTFSVEADEFGVTKLVELKENGALIAVTQENKREFVQLSAQYRLYSSIKEQIEALLGGFYEIIPKDLITIFNEKELELLISGTPDIDVDEWRGATEYNGYTSADPVIVWWWRALKSFNREERAKVLSFATGTSRVPLGGFVELQGVQGVQRFSIHRAYGDTDRLPQAHTCFNQIDLPQYSSYEMLRQQLLLAINEGGEGFGFA